MTRLSQVVVLEVIWESPADDPVPQPAFWDWKALIEEQVEVMAAGPVVIEEEDPQPPPGLRVLRREEQGE